VSGNLPLAAVVVAIEIRSLRNALYLTAGVAVLLFSSALHRLLLPCIFLEIQSSRLISVA
jgi:hypothetical protein